jgi:hypothetical protein
VKLDDEHQLSGESAPEEPVPGKRQKKSSERPSMRRELMELFRDTRLDPPGGLPRAGEAAPYGAVPDPAGVFATPEPSRFLRRFLQRSAPSPEPARSGLACLDRYLGGGFSGGLHLVLGEQAAGRTAFLESIAWEAVVDRRPALYYAFKDGSLDVWERLIVTLGAITGRDGIVPSALRGADLVPSEKEALHRLDAELQSSVLPYLSLLDRVTGPGADLSGFIDRLRSRSQEEAERHGRLPLVLVDDLEELTAITGSRSPLHLLSRLDAALAAHSLPGVVTAWPDATFLRQVDQLPVRSVMALVEPAGGSSERVELEVLKNTATGWTGSVPLLLDPASGLFAETARAC